jgi:F0F1-type ATP synthase membrane subunit b/b'
LQFPAFGENLRACDYHQGKGGLIMITINGVLAILVCGVFMIGGPVEMVLAGGDGHVQETINHAKEGIKHEKEAIKHLEESIKASNDAHAKEALEHAKEAIKHAEESLSHAEQAAQSGKAKTGK